MQLSVRFGACGAPNFPGTCQKSPPRPALRGGAGDQFFLAPPRAPFGAPYIRGPVSSISRGPFLVPPAKSPLRGPGFCGAPSGSPFLAVPRPGPLVPVPRPGPRFFPMESCMASVFNQRASLNQIISPPIFFIRSYIVSLISYYPSLFTSGRCLLPWCMDTASMVLLQAFV